MYNVWNTIHPEDVASVISYANEMRYSLASERVKEDTILVTEDWKKEIESLPFVSKQKGRMSHLLKKKSKVGIVRKERVKYESYDFMKRMRTDPSQLAQS